MSAQLRTEIEIQASPELVWKVLTDFDTYSDWNPFIRLIHGDVVTGSRLRARIQPPGSFGMTLRPKVVAAVPNEELRWLGHLGIPGLFDGEHGFRIERMGPEQVRFVHEERFTGLLAPLVTRFLERNTLQGFDDMNQALKARVEQTPSSHQ